MRGFRHTSKALSGPCRAYDPTIYTISRPQPQTLVPAIFWRRRVDRAGGRVAGHRGNAPRQSASVLQRLGVEQADKAVRASHCHVVAQTCDENHVKEA